MSCVEFNTENTPYTGFCSLLVAFQQFLYSFRHLHFPFANPTGSGTVFWSRKKYNSLRERKKRRPNENITDRKRLDSVDRFTSNTTSTINTLSLPCDADNVLTRFTRKTKDDTNYTNCACVTKYCNSKDFKNQSQMNSFG